QLSEVNVAQCPAFSSISTFYDPAGVNWPYSDEVTAGVERQVMRDMRVGAMFYYRTNRDQIGQKNIAVPTSAYTKFTVPVPNGPDLNDPNVTLYPNGIVGNDSKYAFRLSGSYHLPYDFSFAGSLISNQGYPYISTVSVSRALAATQGITLTRSSQTVLLSNRG